ncbi:MAG: hypothetical protein OEQ81_13095, partial [Flavobacteriaceae bacterium]|nr:hypothetical protein [Flavobacteriaceae bacterium]
MGFSVRVGKPDFFAWAVNGIEDLLSIDRMIVPNSIVACYKNSSSTHAFLLGRIQALERDSVQSALHRSRRSKLIPVLLMVQP